MNLFRLGIICVTALALGSCNKKSTAEGQATGKEENQVVGEARERSGEPESPAFQPEKEDIGEDCVAFLRSTVATRTDTTPGQCPVCPSSVEKTEVLGIDTVSVEKVNNVGIDGTSCEADVLIRAHFNPSNGGTITGGLVGWIPAEQRTQYTRGVIPAGQQVYQVKITYRREGDEWQPADFARP